MKNILLALIFFVLPNLASASTFEEGKHYVVVSQQATSTPELREYFSYYCPTCRAYEPYLGDFKKALPTNAKFQKTHVDFMGQTSPEIQFMLAKALIVAEKRKLDKKFSANVFAYLQTERKKIATLSDVRDIYTASGGKGTDFDKGMKSFTVVSHAKKNKKVQDKLSKARQLKSVPTMIVNGKYLINASALDKNNFFKEYTDLVSYLFTLS